MKSIVNVNDPFYELANKACSNQKKAFLPKRQ